jgi:hypothetical protein
MYSLTLQNAGGNSIITSGDILGRLSYAVPSESDGASATYVVSQIYSVAEGSFTSASNPAGLLFATSSADSAPATGRIKINGDGHFIPLASGTYDLGSPSLPFRNLYINSGDITAQSGYFDVISFNVDDESILTKGQISWDDTEGTMDIGLTDNTSIHIGSHKYFRIRNSTGDTLYKGQAVFATGVHENGIIEPDKYVADGSIREVYFMGLMLEDVSNNSNGYAIDFGHLEEMDLDGSATNFAVGDETWVAGDILYVHPTGAGKLTKVEPKHSISVAIVLDPGNGNGNGRMFVRPTSYGHLDDNHDVNTSGLLDNQFLVYDSGTDYWQPSSGLYYVDGDLGIGTASPETKLDVRSTIQAKAAGVKIQSVDSSVVVKQQAYSAGNVGILGTESNHNLEFRANNIGYMYLTTSGNVGIGTDSPLSKLHVRDTTDSDCQIVVDNGTARAKLQTLSNICYAGTITDHNFVLRTNNTTRITLSNSSDQGLVLVNPLYNDQDFEVRGASEDKLIYVDAGANNVGIGIGVPTQRLHVYEAGNAQVLVDDGTVKTKVQSLAGQSKGIVGTNSNHDLEFRTNNNGKMIIKAGGDVGIGTASPSYKLDVNGTFSANSINVNDQFTFPTTDGSADQVLVTNGSGALTWQDQQGAASSSNYIYSLIFR